MNKTDVAVSELPVFKGYMGYDDASTFKMLRSKRARFSF